MMALLGRLALLFLLTVMLGGCDRRAEVVSSVLERDGNEVMSLLLSHGIEVEKEKAKDGSVSIWVAQDKQAAALNVLQAAGLPRPRFSQFGELFKKDGLISSPLEERARMLFALSQGLEHTLSNIDGVITAKVHVVLPERQSALEASLPSSAAVFLKHQPQSRLAGLLPQIRQLVANAIPGLKPDAVSVALVPGQLPEDSMPLPMVVVFGFRVAADSAFGLRMTLGLMTLALLLSAALTAWRWQQPKTALAES